MSQAFNSGTICTAKASKLADFIADHGMFNVRIEGDGMTVSFESEWYNSRTKESGKVKHTAKTFGEAREILGY